MAKKEFARNCTACSAGMNEGYHIGGNGIEYYCSDACLHTEITHEEYMELYDDGEGDSYWTDGAKTLTTLRTRMMRRRSRRLKRKRNSFA